LLTPENKSRIKVREIFNHSWVVEFEKQFKEEKIKASANHTDSNNTSAFNSTLNSNNSVNKLADSLINECISDNKSINSKNKLNSELIEKNQTKSKTDKTISERIDENLNKKNKDFNRISENEKIKKIDLNEIENKLNSSINKHKEHSLLANAKNDINPDTITKSKRI